MLVSTAPLVMIDLLIDDTSHVPVRMLYVWKVMILTTRYTPLFVGHKPWSQLFKRSSCHLHTMIRMIYTTNLRAVNINIAIQAPMSS
jgi:hypothetical protein